ncbi:MAG: hypothetical protein O6746_00090, partial [Thaumarchaeota archaeon]|nr:hypothetical protein [Nitrososphaerota archaeon]
MMITHLKVFALFAIMIAGISGSPVFGQTIEPIAITTDKEMYANGETIIVSGVVKDLLSGYQISLQVFEPRFGNQVAIQQFGVGPDKKFTTEITAGGGLWRSDGTYTIKVLYGSQSRTAETTFEFSGSGVPLPKPVPQPISNLNVVTDKTSYKNGEMIKISGEEAVRTQKIIVNIISNRGQEVAELTIRSTSAGVFSTIWIIPNGLDSGTYTIKVNDSFNTATTSFRLLSDSPPPIPPAPTPTPTPTPTEVEVRNAPGSSVPGCEETNECFIPGVVNIAIGGMVTWVNDDTAAHTSTSGSAADGPDGNWDSSLVISGSSFSHTFDEVGKYPYFCMVHPWMTGIVYVGLELEVSKPPTPFPTPRISISASTDQAVYDLGDIVNLRVKISGTTSSQNVGVSVSDPTGKA